MFEPKSENDTEHKRSRAILWLGAAVGVLITALALLLAYSRPQNSPALENAVRGGNPEFDAYKDKIKLEVIEKIVHPNMIGMAQYEVQARLTNSGDRTITGVEIVGKIQGMDDKIIAQSVSRPIPRSRTAPLKPGESMKVSVKIDRPGNVSDADVKELLIELLGLRF